MKWRYILYAPAVLLIGALGYAFMHSLIYIVPMSSGDNTFYILVTLAIIALGLVVPFWMLQVGFKGVQMYDSDQPLLHLKDLPKDESDLVNEH